MISDISKKIYEILSQDATLRTMLPAVKDSSNVWELRVPAHTNDSRYPVIAFRVVSGTPLLEVLSLNALNWFVEIDIIDNQSSLSRAWDIYARIYALLHNANISIAGSPAYRCTLDFVNTDYDSNTLVHFILTRFQIFSLENN